MMIFGSANRGRRIGMILDRINIVLSAAVIISAVFLVLDMEKYKVAFPVLFSFSSLLNFSMAYKYYKMAEMLNMLILVVVAVVLAVLAFMGARVAINL